MGLGGVFLGGVGCILLFVWFFLYSFAYTRLWRIGINANDLFSFKLGDLYYQLKLTSNNI